MNVTVVFTLMSHTYSTLAPRIRVGSPFQISSKFLSTYWLEQSQIQRQHIYANTHTHCQAGSATVIRWC